MNNFSISVEYIYGGEITLKDDWTGENRENVTECDKIYFITDGECEIEIEGTIYKGRKGDAFFIKRQTAHKYRLTELNYMKKYWFHVNVNYKDKPLFEELSLPYYHHFNDFEKADEKFSRIAELSKTKSILGQIQWSNAFLEVLNLYYESAGSVRENEYKSDMGNVVKYILDHQYDHISVDELAKIAHLQPNYFIKKFKQEVGMSPTKFINWKKYELIEGLLTNNDTPIKEIMRKTGFDDLGYFSHFFKKYSGYSPKKYREACKEVNRSLRKL